MRIDRSEEVSAKVVVDVVLLEEFKDLYVGLENQDCAQWQLMVAVLNGNGC